ncbi:hypothetical protein LTR16_002727 [Cryomyces antarcticus]|uniref:SWI5-dependent HO expression protein 3 n=1 Tax=Cryomyces antarcticus TaxID=329879 RepID=A0ABR0M9V1_9PEZI|nr:hypothetical protein LTR39_004380 [Cryomyces antarcticus]KAK5290106.1 hypothetical protein LTR16_002727 [Cryomyces antarcticus]
MTAGEQTNIDDTCFSAFSEIPDMTVFAKLGVNSARSPAKTSGFDSCRTPRANAPSTPGTSRKRISPSRSPSPTPRRQRTPAHNGDNTTSLLLDFTQQIEAFSSIHAQKSPTRSHRLSPAKSNTEPNLLSFINGQRSPAKGRGYGTPSKNSNILNLLDFELPPAPTPRSIPTITVRELESLKSSYLSEISSLKATLHGREAEVESLKKAVGDAERRVGEALETVREECSTREHVEKEKAEWEKRGTEVEAVLMSVKEEVMRSDREKEDLVRKVDHCTRRLEEAETRVVKAEQKAARAVEAEQKAARAVELAGIASEGGDTSAKTEELVQRQVQAQLDQKIEAVSRELHAVYKKKHETKVATLKKSYEARSEKKCAELQTRIEELQAAKGTSSPTQTLNGSDLKRLEEQRAEIQDQKTRLADLADKVQTLKISHTHLLAELEKERVEKGELVAAVDEMLSLQSEAGVPSAIGDFCKSISKPSGLRGPGFGGNGESRIGRVGAPSLLGRSVSGGKSRIMSNIERMGGGRPAE